MERLLDADKPDAILMAKLHIKLIYRVLTLLMPHIEYVQSANTVFNSNIDI